MSNYVSVEGNLGFDPEVREVGDNTVANVNIAFYNGKDKDGNNKSGWIRVTAWNHVANRIAQLSKGDRIVVSGRLDYQEWESSEGEKRNVLGVVATTVSKIERVSSQEEKEAPKSKKAAPKSKNKKEVVEEEFALEDDEDFDF